MGPTLVPVPPVAAAQVTVWGNFFRLRVMPNDTPRDESLLVIARVKPQMFENLESNGVG